MYKNIALIIYLSLIFTPNSHSEESANINPVTGAGALKILSQGRFGFTEGPAWIPDKNVLLFSDLKKPLGIYRFTPPDKIDHYSRDNKRSNGIGWDPRGFVVINHQNPQGISRAKYGDTTHKLVANNYNGKVFLKPNDNVVRSDGVIYMTGWNGNEAYWIETNNTVHLIDTYEGTNGIALSPDEKTLYMSLRKKNVKGSEKILKFDITPIGKPINPRLFAQLTSVCDGIAIDDHGNVYATPHEGIEVFKKDGTRIGLISLDIDGDGKNDVRATNVAFGGKDRKTLFITTSKGHLLSMDMPIPGLP